MMIGGQQLLSAQTRYVEIYNSGGAGLITLEISGEEQIAELSREQILIAGEEE